MAVFGKHDRPGRLGAHRSEVAQVDRKGTVTDITCTGVGREMYTVNNSIYGNHKTLVLRYADNSCIVTDTEIHIRPLQRMTCEVSVDDFEFARGHYLVTRIAPPPRCFDVTGPGLSYPGGALRVQFLQPGQERR